MASSSRKLSDFKIIGFDTMGTLIDEKAGICAASDAVRNRRFPQISPDEFYETFETELKKNIRNSSPPKPYAKIMADAFGRTTNILSNGDYEATEEESSTFAKALADWPAFDDTVASMQYLAKGAKLIALTNMDTATIVELATEGSLKDVPFSELLGGDKSGAFKPDHRVNSNLLQTAEKKFGVAKEQVLLVAQGLTSDHVPAKEMGISSAWIDRYGAGKGSIPNGADPTWVFSNLDALVAELKREL